jgi:hypothetical protein
LATHFPCFEVQLLAATGVAGAGAGAKVNEQYVEEFMPHPARFIPTLQLPLFELVMLLLM